MFSNSITELFDTCFPLRTVKRGYKTRKPWLTEGLKKSIQRKNKLYYRKQKSNKAEDELLYKQYRNKLNRLLHISEQQHYGSLLKANKNNLRNSWHIMKDIISKNKTSSSCSRFYIDDGVNITNDKKVIAEKFNSFFVNVGPNLAKKIPPNSQSWTASMIRNINSMAVLPVNESEVIDIIKNLKNILRGIQSRQKWWKLRIPTSLNLWRILWICLSHKVYFQKELKLAKVIILFKTGDPMIFSNYRPVSVLPLFSKILENLMYTRLLSFINKYKLLYSYQFEFVGVILLIWPWFAL